MFMINITGLKNNSLDGTQILILIIICVIRITCTTSKLVQMKNIIYLHNCNFIIQGGVGKFGPLIPR